LLLVLAGGIVQIGRLYMKGMNAARTQQVARQTLDTVAQSIQFTGGAVSTVPTNGDDSLSQGFCVGTRLYSYRLGQERKENANSLVLRNTGGSCSGTPADRLNNGPATPSGPIVPNQDPPKELLAEKMRLSKFTIDDVGNNQHKVTVRIVYGDVDLLCGSAVGGGSAVSCNDDGSGYVNENDVLGVTDLACKNIRSGSQFCAVSELTTTVGKRL
jgi:hypothetical protein